MNYFTLQEMRCKDADKTPYPAKWEHDRWARHLRLINAVRERWGHGVLVLSGYRTRLYNASIGGAKFSQHVEGRATDLRPTGLPADVAQWTQAHYEVINAFHALALEMHRSGELPELGGIGKYPTFVHLDSRQGESLAQWGKTA